MAIDSSIWIYQFQATMRDKEGRALVNAHVLGFLRRICKLLFYGIKPVFVFDGGAPALKRMTIVCGVYIPLVWSASQQCARPNGNERKLVPQILMFVWPRSCLPLSYAERLLTKTRKRGPPRMYTIFERYKYIS